MKLYFYKAKGGNFGDDLNEFLWNPLLDGMLLGRRGEVFIAIGSIFDERLAQVPGKKIIFGTGVRSQSSVPVIDGSYDIRFVRGPISAQILSSRPTWITDPAIALRLFRWPQSAKSFDVGFMPHFLSASLVDWREICKETGVRLINPQGTVEKVLSDIRACKLLITEAMHGAIVADAFRIPWLRVSIHAWQREGFDVSSLKWLDWGLSLDVDVTPVHLEPIYAWRRRTLLNPVRLTDRITAKAKIIKDLRELARAGNFRLSPISRTEEATAEVADHVARLREERDVPLDNYPIAPPSLHLIGRTSQEQHHHTTFGARRGE